MLGSIRTFRPLRAPGLDQARQVGRLRLVVHLVVGDGEPTLRAPGPDMPDRIEPGGVVEGPRLGDAHRRDALRVMDEPHAAGAAKQAVNDPAARVNANPLAR